MIKLNLTELQTQEIAEALDDPRTTDRAKTKLLAIRMHSLGMPHGKIAAALNISDDTVTNYVKTFRKGGVAQLIENRHFRPTSSVEPFLQEITDSLTHCPVATAKEGAHRIKEITGIELSEDQARRIMKRIGLAYRKTAAIPGGVDPQTQFTFLQDELIPRLEEAREGKRRVFFVDAAHFVLGAFLGMIWCPAPRVCAHGKRAAALQCSWSGGNQRSRFGDNQNKWVGQCPNRLRTHRKNLLPIPRRRNYTGHGQCSLSTQCQCL